MVDVKEKVTKIPKFLYLMWIKSNATSLNMATGAAEGIVNTGENIMDAGVAIEGLGSYTVLKTYDSIKGTDHAHDYLVNTNAFIKDRKTEKLFDKLYDTKAWENADELSMDFFKRNEGGEDASTGYKGAEKVGEIGVEVALAAIPEAGPILSAVAVGTSGAGSDIEDTLNEMDEKELNDELDLLLADTKGVVKGTFDGIFSYVIRGKVIDKLKGTDKVAASAVETTADGVIEKTAETTTKKTLTDSAKKIIKTKLSKENVTRIIRNKFISQVNNGTQNVTEMTYDTGNFVKDIVTGDSKYSDLVDQLISCNSFDEFKSLIKDKSFAEVNSITDMFVKKMQGNAIIDAKFEELKEKLKYLQEQVARGEQVANDMEETYDAIMEDLNNGIQAIQSR